MEPVGHGGFAQVWKARDLQESREVAIKVLHPHLAHDPIRLERFRRGAQVMRELAHPAVVRVLATTAEDEGFHYYVMELVLGDNLDRVVKAGRLRAEADVLPLILQISDALAEAHAKGKIHRDIKPSNIVLDEAGSPKLTDFDLVGGADTTGGTHTGMLGSAYFAAPECHEKPQEATARADVYSLGMTAMFCLCGPDLIGAMFVNRAQALAQLRCSSQLKAVLERAVRVAPTERFSDAAALGAALRGVLRAPPAPGSMEVGGPASSRYAGMASRRWAVRVGGGAALVLTLAVVAYGVSLVLHEGDPAVEVPPDAQGGAPSADADLVSCPGGMVRVPVGTFQMGSPDRVGYSDEHPQHEVTLSGYCLDRTEVTVAAYAECVVKKGCKAGNEAETYCNGADRPDHPINCVDWKQAETYCKWANKRLPTEAEWEYAARGTDGRTYPWGEDPPSGKRLNACGRECGAKVERGMYPERDGWETTAPVGRFPAGASPFGILDMAGNVWEWTADWHGAYEEGRALDPPGAKTGDSRVIRGGGWLNDDVDWVRAAHRLKNDPSVRRSDVGFRCARGD